MMDTHKKLEEIQEVKPIIGLGFKILPLHGCRNLLITMWKK